MRRSLIDMLVDPLQKKPMKLIDYLEDGEGEIIQGTLVSSSGESYPIIDGIPRFVITQEIDQKQTEHSFSYKWAQQNTYDSPEMHNTHQQWLVDKYGFDDIDGMRDFFGNRKNILDAGCGAGLSASTWLTPSWQKNDDVSWCGVDISEAVDVAQQRLGEMPSTHFIQADIMQLPFLDGMFDIIFSEGVLHHTPSTKLAIKSLAPLLCPGGEILFYVYRKKGPIREFTDDYIRDIISPLSPAEAWDLIKPLTKLVVRQS